MTSKGDFNPFEVKVWKQYLEVETLCRNRCVYYVFIVLLNVFYRVFSVESNLLYSLRLYCKKSVRTWADKWFLESSTTVNLFMYTTVRSAYHFKYKTYYLL